jgi:ABC-type sugar transport system substrate-binding protein
MKRSLKLIGVSAFGAACALAMIAVAGCSSHSNTGPGTGATSSHAGKQVTVCLLPKKKGLAYFTSCSAGAYEAAKELGDVNLIYDGPTDGSPETAASMIETWTLKHADVIAVSPSDPDVLEPAMVDARKQGTHVITWDADAHLDSRELFVDQATSEQIGDALVDAMAKDLGGPKATGKVAIITAQMTAANQNEWISFMKKRLPKYPGLQLIAIKPSNDDQTQAYQVTQDLMKAYPDLKGIFGISSVAFPGAAEAVKQAGMGGKVLVTGLSTPDNMKQYVKSGIVRNTKDLGYLTVYAAEGIATGKLKPTDTSFKAGRLGECKIVDGKLLLGNILVFTKDNIDQYDF